jgi:hypothetical protein
LQANAKPNIPSKHRIYLNQQVSSSIFEPKNK